MLDDLEQLPEASSTHLNVFAERYNRLYAAARSLTNSDNEQARELVHDALIEFVRYCPDLHKITNINGYLYTIIRNLSKAQKQRLHDHSVYELSIENYDSFEFELSLAPNCHYNLRLRLQMQDVLRTICEYACFRKERLKLGSVMILRFFHGYHTSEIAQIMSVTASSVSQLLKLARAEVRLYLSDPRFLNSSQEIATVQGSLRLNYGCLVEDLVDELRAAIFRSFRCRGSLLRDKLNKLYGGQRRAEIDCKTLAHIVSCPLCLDTVNDFLGLDLLAARYPVGMQKMPATPRYNRRTDYSGG